MYKIKLPVFEGPFDLLLYLIKKNEIDIYDIPIADIIRQYLEYLELMTLLDLEVAGEFVEMVATLMLIKARMLLPAEHTDEEGLPEDPRQPLILQLLEYKRFKEASQELSRRESERLKRFAPAADHLRKKYEQATDDAPVREASLFDLLTAFKRALDNMPRVTVHSVQTIKITLEDQVKYIFDALKNRPHILFHDLVKPFKEKMYLIVTFMALLDLVRLQMIKAVQSEVFGEIRLQPLGELSLSRYYQLRSHEMTPNDSPEASAS